MEKVKVLKNNTIAPKAHLIRLDTSMSFVAGQVIEICIEKGSIPRMYSIASSPNMKYIEILFDVKTKGELSPQLANLNSGDELYISAPSGSFVDKGNTAWWIATGTGIAPYRSMLKNQSCNNKKLIHGVRKAKQLYFRKEFEDALKKNYIPCCSNENDGNVFQGRVTDYIESLNNIPRDINYYLCGNAEMIVDMRDILILKGVPYNKILAEIYF
ncbi:MAG: FAD-binding oxidoreductase [Bacteroidales bacterium]